MNIITHIKNYSELFLFFFLKIVLPKARINTNSLLLINTGEIGDLVVSSVLLENPDIFDSYKKVDFLIKEYYLELFNNYTGEVNFIGYNYKKYKFSPFYKYSFLSKLRKEGYEQCIHLTAARGILNEEMTHLVGAKEVVTINSFWEYLGNRLGKYFDKKYTQVITSDILNEYDKHFNIIKFLRGDNDKEIIFNKGITFEEGFTEREDYIVIAPFTSLMNRGWREKYFSELIRLLALKHSIKLLGSEDQEDDLKKLSNRDKNVQIIAGKLRLNEIPILLKRAKLFIGLDSGLTHIALKIGTPIVAIIGGGEFGRFFPYKESAQVKFLYHKMDCFLCHWECLKEEMFCLTEITPQDVMKEIEKVI